MSEITTSFQIAAEIINPQRLAVSVCGDHVGYITKKEYEQPLDPIWGMGDTQRYTVVKFRHSAQASGRQVTTFMGQPESEIDFTDPKMIEQLLREGAPNIIRSYTKKGALSRRRYNPE